VFRAFALLAVICGLVVSASAEETKIRIGVIDAVLTVPPDVERPAVALLIAGSGPTDRDGNGPGINPATLKKLAEQLAARKIATLRYDKRGMYANKASLPASGLNVFGHELQVINGQILIERGDFPANEWQQCLRAQFGMCVRMASGYKR